MDTKLQILIKEAQQLSPLEQLNLISALSQSLSHQLPPTINFWEAKTLEQLVQEQQTRPVTDIKSLHDSFWPQDESVDDFIEYIYQQRREDSLKEY